MQLSYWEYKTWFSDIDFTIVGSGIVGLSCALRLRERFPKSKILILERGFLPQGASTKNAGFACFGSISEILEDLKTHTEAEVLALIKQRISGLQWLRTQLGDEAIDYQGLGGFELFTQQDGALYESCIANIERTNELLYPIFQEDVYRLLPNDFGFQNIQPQLIFNGLEGQIDTGKMMQSFLKKVKSSDIQIINNTTVTSYEPNDQGVSVNTNHFSFKTKQLLIATNGFAGQLNISEVQPARAQVIVTNPIPDLQIKGTFHLDKGYYYFRNIDNRILLGGGRNLDFQTEETTQFGQTALVQNELERLLREVILPDTEITIDQRWSGIMGVGNQKKPIVKQLEPNVYCGVRLGGMGVAIGSQVGRNLAGLMGD